MGTVIHASGLEHQQRVAKALSKGTGWAISNSPHTEADLHVVIGPWFALKHWRLDNTLYLDRAYWGDPNCVSVHWLKHGEKVRTRGREYRAHPVLQPLKSGHRRLYLCDYGRQPCGHYDTVRYHPADKRSKTTLRQDLEAHDVAIGCRTTALVDAAFMGLTVETNDPHSPVYGLTDREQWARDLAWHNWHTDELESGAFLDGIGDHNGCY